MTWYAFSWYTLLFVNYKSNLSDSLIQSYATAIKYIFASQISPLISCSSSVGRSSCLCSWILGRNDHYSLAALSTPGILSPLRFSTLFHSCFGVEYEIFRRMGAVSTPFFSFGGFLDHNTRHVDQSSHLRKCWMEN